MKAKVIGDPYYGLNDFDLRWVAWANWTYQTTLSADKSSSSSSYLLFNGLDTFADIDLCGERVASTSNQFRQYYFNISRVIRQCKGPQVLSINFGSAAAIAKNISELPGQESE
jgi:beta-mannosidase